MAWCGAPSSPGPGPEALSKDPLRHKTRAVTRQVPHPHPGRTERPGSGPGSGARGETEGRGNSDPRQLPQKGRGQQAHLCLWARLWGMFLGPRALPGQTLQGPPHPSRSPPPSRPYRLPRRGVLTAGWAGLLWASPSCPPPPVPPHWERRTTQLPDKAPGRREGRGDRGRVSAPGPRFLPHLREEAFVRTPVWGLGQASAGL